MNLKDIFRASQDKAAAGKKPAGAIYRIRGASEAEMFDFFVDVSNKNDLPLDTTGHPREAEVNVAYENGWFLGIGQYGEVKVGRTNGTVIVKGLVDVMGSLEKHFGGGRYVRSK